MRVHHLAFLVCLLAAATPALGVGALLSHSGDRVLYADSHTQTPERQDPGQAQGPGIIPRTELWWVSRDGSIRELAAVVLQNAEMLGWQGEDDSVVRLRLTSIGAWAGEREYEMGVAFVPWLDEVGISLNLDSLAVTDVGPVADPGFGDRVFSGEGPDGKPGIWLRNAGGKPDLLLDGFYPQGLSISPDGTQVVLARAKGYVGDAPIVILDLGTGGMRETGLLGAAPCFSSDGSRIYYSAGTHGGTWYRGVPVSGRLFVANADGSDPWPLQAEGETGFAPHPSPDGEWIAFSRMSPEDDDHRCSLWVTNRLDPANPFEVSPDAGEGYAWASDNLGIITWGPGAAIHRFTGAGKVDHIPLGDGAPRSFSAQRELAFTHTWEALASAFRDHSAGKSALLKGDFGTGRPLLRSADAGLRAALADADQTRLVPWDIERYADRDRDLAALPDSVILEYKAYLQGEAPLPTTGPLAEALPLLCLD